MHHCCPICEEEAIVERCPNYDHDAELDWDEEDSNAVTNPDDGNARMGLLEAVQYVRANFGRHEILASESGVEVLEVQYGNNGQSGSGGERALVGAGELCVPQSG